MQENQKELTVSDIDRENELYYNNYFQLFRTEGWKSFIEEMEGNYAAINDLPACKTERDMYFRQGQLNVLREIIHIEEMIYNAHKEWAEEDD